MFKKIYNFFKKVLNELDKNNTSNLMIKDSFSSNNVDSLNHKVEVKQPMNEINPANGLISHGGWDIQGNPHGTAFHNSSDSSFNSFGNPFNNDFHNH